MENTVRKMPFHTRKRTHQAVTLLDELELLQTRGDLRNLVQKPHVVRVKVKDQADKDLQRSYHVGMQNVDAARSI